MTRAAPPGVEEALGGEVVRARPHGSVHPGEWNQLEIIMDAQAPEMLLNEGAVNLGGVTSFAGYGPFALYVGGSGEVRFRDLGYKDLNRFVYPERRGFQPLPYAAPAGVLHGVVGGGGGC